MLAYNIWWDTEGEEVDLPDSVIIPDDIAEEDIADYLSDNYEWCVYSFKLKKDEEEMDKIYIGDITLGSEVVISDPCYDSKVWCMGTVDNILPGTYKCYISEKQTGDWGRRIAKLHAIHESEHRQGNERTPIRVGVDSGQCGIYDKEYFEATRHDDEWYHRACEETYHRNPVGPDGNRYFDAGILDGKCIVSSSGYGDGCYDCFVRRNEEGKVVAFTINYYV